MNKNSEAAIKCTTQNCNENTYTWKMDQFPMMKELGIFPMGYNKQICIENSNLSYNKNGKLQINLDNIYLYPTDQSKDCRTWMVYNCGIKTNSMKEYDFDIECNENELISFTLSIYHRQSTTWIIQYFLGLIDGQTDKYMMIGNDIAIPLMQSCYCPTKTIKHYKGQFPAPSESGIYFVTWPSTLHYSFTQGLEVHAKQIGKKIPENVHYTKIARLCVGMSYAEFYQYIAPLIMERYEQFETLLPVLFSYISCRSVTKN